MIVFFIFLSIFLIYYYIKLIRNKEHLTMNDKCNECYKKLPSDLINTILINMNQKINDNSSNIKEILEKTKKIPYLESEIRENNKVFSDDIIDEEEDDDDEVLKVDYTNF